MQRQEGNSSLLSYNPEGCKGSKRHIRQKGNGFTEVSLANPQDNVASSVHSWTIQHWFINNKIKFKKIKQRTQKCPYVCCHCTSYLIIPLKLVTWRVSIWHQVQYHLRLRALISGSYWRRENGIGTSSALIMIRVMIIYNTVQDAVSSTFLCTERTDIKSTKMRKQSSVNEFMSMWLIQVQGIKLLFFLNQ